MTGPKVITPAELEAQLTRNRGWLVLHIGIGIHSLHERSALVFEEARIALEDRLPVEFLRCELSPKDAVECSLAFGATPFLHLFRAGECLESLPAPDSEEEIAELLDFALSFHAPDTRVV